ncbi:MAG TPA: hypothetical protein VM689_25485 [Aliidongia sp.]|nr:hypothetical protein [Aliidongia sp.]
MNGLFDCAEVASSIRSGKRLLIAGDEALLSALPPGDWIGGTIPYFMTDQGGMQTADRLFVDEMPDAVETVIATYDIDRLPNLCCDHPGHGFTVILLPAFTAIHEAFAEQVSGFAGLLARPLVGWVSGVALGDVGRVAPKVFNGTTGRDSTSEAIVMHVVLPESQHASVSLVNLFEQGDGDEISFPDAGFSAATAFVNGEPVNFASYLTDRAIDPALPLVAVYDAAMVNVSVRSVDTAAGQVEFYAPVFPRIKYRIAAPIEDYARSFTARIEDERDPAIFACNCILNYVHAGLEGRTTGRLTGPMTFGEIAYRLLNQTAVYLTIEEL